MPKRKRDGTVYGRKPAGDREQIKKKIVDQKIVYCKKLLHKALKTAKGFTRQRLATRARLAADEGAEGEAELKKLEREIDVLKSLNLDRAVEIHLYKTFAKTKAIASSQWLPEYAKTIPKWDVEEAQMPAYFDMMARLCNLNPVKEAMADITSKIHVVFGIAKKTANKAEKKRPQPEDDVSGDEESDIDSDEANTEAPASTRLRPAIVTSKKPLGVPETELPFEGFSSEDEQGSGSDDEKEEDDFSRYDNLVAGSSDDSDESDEDISNDELAVVKKPRLRRTSQIDSDVSMSPSPPPSKPSSKKQNTKKPDPKKGSTFLPTLMGGYWSGSESATDDDEISGPPVRKNGRGQRARRLIAEKKYGARARHLQRQSRDDGWDPKRGARDDSSRDRKQSGPLVMNRQMRRKANREAGIRGTGDNMIPLGVKPQAGGVKRTPGPKRDDTGPLHPSWEAAKRAKEAKETAAFAGKKIVFD